MRRLRRLSGGAAAVVATNALLAIVALGFAFAEPGAADGPELRLAAASGSLSLTNSKEGAAILSAGAMRPGEQASGTVRIQNTGSVPGALRLARTAGAVDVPGSGGGRLGNGLELGVLDVTDALAPVTLYAGKLRHMDALDVGVIQAGDERQYVFVATLKPSGSADNAYQGALHAVGFTWTAVGSDSAIPSPTPSPGPSSTPGSSATAPTDAPPATPLPSATTPAPLPPGGGPVAADPTGAVLGAQVFAMPSAKRCVSRRKFAIHVRRPGGMDFESVQITVNRKTMVELTGLKARKIKANVNLRGLPKGKVVVTIVAVTTTGRRAVSTRTYRTCAAKRR